LAASDCVGSRIKVDRLSEPERSRGGCPSLALLEVAHFLPRRGRNKSAQGRAKRYSAQRRPGISQRKLPKPCKGATVARCVALSRLSGVEGIANRANPGRRYAEYRFALPWANLLSHRWCSRQMCNFKTGARARTTRFARKASIDFNGNASLSLAAARHFPRGTSTTSSRLGSLPAGMRATTSLVVVSTTATSLRLRTET